MKPMHVSVLLKSCKTDHTLLYIVLKTKIILNDVVTCVFMLTAASDASRGLMGPGSRVATRDGGGSICSVAGLAAISQQGAGGEGAPVSFGLVQQISVLHAGWPHTT